MHYLREVVVGLTEIWQQRLVAVLARVFCDGAADEVKAEALRAVVRVERDPPRVPPLAARLMFFDHAGVVYISFFEQVVRPFCPIAVDERAEEFEPFGRAALDLQQRFAVQPVVARLVKGEDREPVEQILRHQIFADVGHLRQKFAVLLVRFLKDRRSLLRIPLPAVALIRLCVLRFCVSPLHGVPLPLSSA